MWISFSFSFYLILYSLKLKQEWVVACDLELSKTKYNFVITDILD